MKGKMKNLGMQIPFLTLLLVLAGILFPATAGAASTVSVSVTGRQNYSYAQQIVESVNETRSSLGLSELTLDKDLTEAAMQRAAEIAVYYSHTRPDGSSCYTICTRGTAWAENIAAGYSSPSDAMNGWLNSSGHYANIVSENMTSIGVGCFYDGTRWWWVQQFDNASATKLTATGSKTVTRTVSVQTSLLSLYSSSYSVTYGSGIGTTAVIYLKNAGTSSSACYVPMDQSNFNFSSGDASIATVSSDGTITAVDVGETTVTATLTAYTSLSVTFPVTVSQGTQTVSTLATGATTLNIGDTTTWTAGTSGDGKITYYTSNSSILTVDSSGKVTATGLGTGYVYAKAAATSRYQASSMTMIAEIEVTLPTSTITSVSNVSEGIQLVWKEITGASGYCIYRSTSASGTYTLIKSLSGEDTLTWTDSTVRLGTGNTYYYQIRTYKGSYMSEASASVSIKRMGVILSENITLSGTSYAYTGSAIKPDVSVKCDGLSLTQGTDYKVSYSNNVMPGTAKATVTGIGNYTGTAKVSFTIKAKTTAKPTVKRASYSSLKITWKKGSGADGYYVYRSTKSGSGYKKVKTITTGTTLTWTDKNRTTGTTYYYKVKAYKTVDGKNKVIAASRVGSGKATLEKPAVKLTAGTKKVSVKVTKVSGASGYVVYRSTSKSSGYKKVTTVKSGKSFTYKDTGLKSKKTYYYKVRAYRTVNGKKVYSSYSAIVSKKTK